MSEQQATYAPSRPPQQKERKWPINVRPKYLREITDRVNRGYRLRVRVVLSARMHTYVPLAKKDFLRATQHLNPEFVMACRTQLCTKEIFLSEIPTELDQTKQIR